MRAHSPVCAGLSALCVLVVAGSTRADPPKDATPQQGRKAVERGLDFLQKDAARWRKDRECSTCHHGTMTVWALAEAKSRGYDIAPETLVISEEFGEWEDSRRRIDLLGLDKDARLVVIELKRTEDGGHGASGYPVCLDGIDHDFRAGRRGFWAIPHDIGEVRTGCARSNA